MAQHEFLHRCLALAERGRGNVGTNPLVGSVLVRNGKMIAEAAHEKFGHRHAERALMENFQGPIEPDDVLYVNLEPCCHQGKTPPCTEIIMERGVKHVVFGMIDPNPMMAGKGIEALRRAGIECAGPVERARCEWLNRGFVSLHCNNRPWVTIHAAQTRAGAIARPDGRPLTITSPGQDRWTHEWLRARHDAILVGVRTVISDDPQLTARLVPDLPSPLRIVLDPHLRIPLEARVIGEELASGTMMIVAPGSDPEKRLRLEEKGVRVAEVPLREDQFDFGELWKMLMTPQGDFSGVASVLVEGGARTWATFRKAGCVDEEVILVGS